MRGDVVLLASKDMEYRETSCRLGDVLEFRRYMLQRR
jgi:hypothetical protein